jgi:hypothetical protein
LHIRFKISNFLSKLGQTGNSTVCPFSVIKSTITIMMNLVCSEIKTIFALKFDS